MLNTIGPIFPDFIMFYRLYRLILEAFRGVNMRNDKNIGHIAQGEHAVTTLLLTDKISIVC